MSVHDDPEMRHARKSARRRFDGHKAAIDRGRSREPVDHGGGRAAGGQCPRPPRGASKLVEQAEANAAGAAVEETVGDCAYGDGNTRQAFAEAGRKLVAKMANRRRGGAQ